MLGLPENIALPPPASSFACGQEHSDTPRAGLLSEAASRAVKKTLTGLANAVPSDGGSQIACHPHGKKLNCVPACLAVCPCKTAGNPTANAARTYRIRLRMVRSQPCVESPLPLPAHFGQPFCSLVQHHPFLSSLHPASQFE